MDFSNTAKATYEGGSFSSNTVKANLLKDLIVTKTQNGVLTPINVISGEQVDYQVIINNQNSISLSNIKFSDNIPSGMNYLSSSFKVDGVSQIPVITGNLISYTIPTLSGATSVTIDFSVIVI